MFEWLIVSSLQFAIFGSVESDVYKTFDKEMDNASNRQ